MLEKQKIQVLDASNIILGVEHPNTISSMENLAGTNQNLRKYIDGENPQVQAQEVQSIIFEGGHPKKIKPMPNLEDALDTQVLDARSTVPEENTSHSVQVVLNPSVEAVLSDTIINPEKKGMSIGNCFLNTL